MKTRVSICALFPLLLLTLSAAAEEWRNVPMVDTMCAAKVKAKPDDHTRSCALQCQKSGFGIVAADGKFLIFDEAGNKQAIAALKEAKQSDRLRVTVSGTREGNTIKVEKLTL